jgi:DNA (cytosine-5)-methyltransferase 1
MNYYNEFDPYAAQWLRNLIEAGHIPQGEVDSRSIKDVSASDLTGFVQCHFFAGLGGWSHALRLAGWPDDRPVWTGSCPCQPFSAAGTQKGTADDRHLWPVWFNLIRECRPGVVFGEQVEAAINHGWLDLVQSDLESEGYACGAVGLPAGGVGAPHIRQRLWFVADTTIRRHGEYERDTGAVGGERDCDEGQESELGRASQTLGNCSEIGELAESNSLTDERRRNKFFTPQREETGRCNYGYRGSGAFDQLADADSGRHDGWATATGRQAGASTGIASSSTFDQLGDSDDTRSQGRGVSSANNGGGGSSEQSSRTASATNGFWQAADWLPCRDGKARPVEPGTFPLAHGVSARVGRLRAYGNAIVPQVAQVFIEAYLET